MSDCPFCAAENEDVIWSDELCRVLLVAEPGYEGFCRVVLNRHVVEMTDLTADERDHVMKLVWAVEAAQRAVLRPDKVNIAAFGNYVPHIHWHVIPRFKDDPHFPEAFWGPVQREVIIRDHDLNALKAEVAKQCAVI